jgi:multiple antibiotic resistance protein
MNEAVVITPLAIGIVFFSIVVSIVITYFMMRNSDYIMSKIGQREYRAINRLMGMLLIAIAVQFVINGIKMAFPLFAGGQ